MGCSSKIFYSESKSCRTLAPSSAENPGSATELEQISQHHVINPMCVKCLQNKKQRMMVRQAVLKGKDPFKLLEDVESIDKMGK